jgi:hypothetical protein
MHAHEQQHFEQLCQQHLTALKLRGKHIGRVLTRRRSIPLMPDSVSSADEFGPTRNIVSTHSLRRAGQDPSYEIIWTPDVHDHRPRRPACAAQGHEQPSAASNRCRP